MQSHDGRVALVTGAGRQQGLGFEICRQLAQHGFTVLLTARTQAQVSQCSAALSGNVIGHALDVTDDAAVAALAEHVGAHYGRLDALINNASAAFEVDTPSLAVTPRAARAGLNVDVLGAWRTLHAFAPWLVRARGCAVNVSSEAGSFAAASSGLTDFASPWASTLATYCVAKTALNALTLKMAAALRGEVRVNAVSPGFVATHAGLAELGARPVSDGARGVVWAACLPQDGPTGRFFHDGRELAW